MCIEPEMFSDVTDWMNRVPHVFFIYIGFNIATFSFLCQYLNFPRSILADLSNAKENGFPRIAHPAWRERDSWRYIIKFFYENDLVTYAILMYIIFSSLVALCLASVGKKMFTPQQGVWIIEFLTVLYAVLRLYVLIYAIATRRGDPIWSFGEKIFYTAVEIVIISILVAGEIYSLRAKQGIFLLIWLIFVFFIFLAWYLWPTYHRKPITKLLELWNHLDHNQDGPAVPANPDKKGPINPTKNHCNPEDHDLSDNS
ncbi:MAG: hypothetical protein ABSH16_06010 [Sedimentisphaerales bacterium]